jgi:hypothetical protein
MSHNTRLTFGPLVTIIINRDERRRISKVESFFRNEPDGFVLDVSASKQEGTLRSIFSDLAEESYFENMVHHQTEPGEPNSKESVGFSIWLHQCIQKMIAWARTLAISHAYEAVAIDNFELAVETYRDVLDHFPPPADSPLIYWLYYCCRMRINPEDNVEEFLHLWFVEALELSGLDSVNLVLEPAKELLGKEVTVELANEWLANSSLHNPVHKRIKHWLIKIEHSNVGRIVWEVCDGKPSATTESTILNCPNGDVISLGGFDAQGRPSAKVFCWTIQSKKWITLPAMPFPRVHHAAVAMWDNSIIVMGGTIIKDGKTVRFSTAVHCYNPLKKEWEELSPLLIGREHLAAITFRGRIIVVGGESPLQLDSFVEIWDRRAKSWIKNVDLGLRLKKVLLQNYQGEIFITGASVSSVGYGALCFNPRKETIQPLDTLQGDVLDGFFSLQNNDLMVWNKQAGGLRAGIWSPRTKEISWTLPEILVPTRDDLLQIIPCEDDRFLLLYQRDNGRCGLKLLTPLRPFVDELEPLEGNNRLPFLSAINIVDGRVMITDHHNTFLLTI